MRVRRSIKDYGRFVKRVYGPDARLAAAIYAFYALCRTDVVPVEWQEALPTVRQVVTVGPPWFPWLVGLGLLSFFTLRGTYRIVRVVDLDLRVVESPPATDLINDRGELRYFLRFRVFNDGLEGEFRAQVSYVQNNSLTENPPWYTGWANHQSRDYFIGPDGNHGDLNLIAVDPVHISPNGYGMCPVFPHGISQAYQEFADFQLQVSITKVGTRGSTRVGVRLEIANGKPAARRDDLVLP